MNWNKLSFLIFFLLSIHNMITTTCSTFCIPCCSISLNQSSSQLLNTITTYKQLSIYFGCVQHPIISMHTTRSMFAQFLGSPTRKYSPGHCLFALSCSSATPPTCTLRQSVCRRAFVPSFDLGSLSTCRGQRNERRGSASFFHHLHTHLVAAWK